ncbi:MAG: preprotein translocase subunit SecA [Oligoflexia bacterium]|nr:preprotein translocase subunit SecA [Oligoflexia bacterium]
MLKKIIKAIFSTSSERDMMSLQPILDKVNHFEQKMKNMSDDELKSQTTKFKELLKEGKKLDSLLPEAFATVREASVRTLGMRPFDVQILGAIVLHQGKIAEMKTGEGKTLCATLPMYLNALTEKGVHLVTVNDYLAKRDAEWMGVIYNFLGLSVGVIVADMSDEERIKAYNSDITYGTNNEFAFDYLRDNMKFDLKDYVQREHNYCIVDEVDSILIDEARTPLLISGQGEGNNNIYKIANKIIPQLNKDVHYKVEEKHKSSVFTDPGVIKVQEMLKIKNLFEPQHATLFQHLNQSLKAWTLFKKDIDYVIKENKVIIVDEFTGRLKEGSRWSDGLHQAVEAKEGVEVKSENQTLASTTFQNYFRLYSKLAGMTGTAETESEEFRKIYNLPVVVVPTNLPMIREDWDDVVYKDIKSKYNAVIDLIKEIHEKGQPLLVGTTSIDKSELISERLKQIGIPHEVLNAKQHEKEAIIISKAGRKGGVTIATNMAGRGTDIKLTEETVKLGGLFILGTERHDARRIDNQLRGRSGRQGDPGVSKFFVSLEDDLLRIFGPDKIKSIMNNLKLDEDGPIEHQMITDAIADTQRRVEVEYFNMRKYLLDYDNVLNEQRKSIYRLRIDILNNKENMELIKEMITDVVAFISKDYNPKRNDDINSCTWEELQKRFKNYFHTDYELSLAECDNNYRGEVDHYQVAIANKLLNDKFSKYEPEQVKNAIREILLSSLDHHWKYHLLNLDHLKEGASLKAYAQQDPLIAYRSEAFKMLENMKNEVRQTVVHSVFGVTLYTAKEIEEIKRQREAYLASQLEGYRKGQINNKNSNEQREAGTLNRTENHTENRTEKKVGRNEMCPCGSGKKYKHCHGS